MESGVCYLMWSVADNCLRWFRAANGLSILTLDLENLQLLTGSDGFLKVQLEMLCCLKEDIFVAGSGGLETINSAYIWCCISRQLKWLWLCSACPFVLHAGVTSYFGGKEKGRPYFSKTRMTHDGPSPWGCALWPCILSPLWQEGRSLLGLRALAGPRPVSCFLGCHGGRGR